MRAGYIAFGLCLFFSAVAVAEPGTPEQRAACTDDAFRFCEQNIPDAAAVEACLRRNLAGLSPNCRAQFGEVKKGKGKKR
jgi:hypothetical protein